MEFAEKATLILTSVITILSYSENSVCWQLSCSLEPNNHLPTPHPTRGSFPSVGGVCGTLSWGLLSWAKCQALALVMQCLQTPRFHSLTPPAGLLSQANVCQAPDAFPVGVADQHICMLRAGAQLEAVKISVENSVLWNVNISLYPTEDN